MKPKMIFLEPVKVRLVFCLLFVYITFVHYYYLPCQLDMFIIGLFFFVPICLEENINIKY